uniref:ParB/Sulfiredoxin domain-containing protein n=1 Tax=Chrysotila carterae TaxID=13221 RepID=A0A7S4AYI9_CHRCT
MRSGVMLLLPWHAFAFGGRAFVERLSVPQISTVVAALTQSQMHRRRQLCTMQLSGSPEMEHVRGGLGGLAPMHLNVDSRLIHGFRWVESSELVQHEEVRSDKSDALRNYLSTQGRYATIPAIVACSRTGVIIDGHHRHCVLQQLGVQVLPVVYIDYSHEDVLVHDDPDTTLCKQDVINCVCNKTLLPPKSTKHVVRAAGGALLPIVCLSPNCPIAIGKMRH